MPCASQTSACGGEIGGEYVKKVIIIILPPIHFTPSLCRSFKAITGGQVSNSDWPLVSEEHPYTYIHTLTLTPSQNNPESLRKYAAHSVNTGYI